MIPCLLFLFPDIIAWPGLGIGPAGSECDSTCVPRSGCFYSRGNREPEPGVGVTPSFLSGMAQRPSVPLFWLTSQNPVWPLHIINSVPVDSSPSCLILDCKVSFGCKDSWTCSQLISSRLLSKNGNSKKIRKLALKQAFHTPIN